MAAADYLPAGGGLERWRAPVEALRRCCDPASLGFETTDEVTPLAEPIGQERALQALEVGLNIAARGFNLFVSGAPGTGRRTALRGYLERSALSRPSPPDWAYVHNFQEPAQPRPLSLPCGLTRQLVSDMEQLIADCRREIPAAFNSRDYTDRIAEVSAGIGRRQQAVQQALEAQARQRGFALAMSPAGMSPAPLHPEGRPLSQEELARLPESSRQELERIAGELQREIAHAMVAFRNLNREAQELTGEVDRGVVRRTIQPIVDELQARFAGYPEVVEFLDQVEADMVAHTEVFKSAEAGAGGAGGGNTASAGGNAVSGGGSSGGGVSGGGGDGDFFARYRINDLVDNTYCNGAPVVFESSPSYYNLFGRIDYRARLGALTTDHLMVRAGALHQANGGYLVLEARDVLANPLAWETLKRVLRSEEIRIENIGEQQSPQPASSLRPQPIPVDAKVVLVGGPETLRLLQAADADFPRLFKVIADFDTALERTPENIAKYAAFVAARVADNRLRPFDKTAVAALVEYASRLAEDQHKLATQFLRLSDVLTEADYWAGQDGGGTVTDEHLIRALREGRRRAGLAQDRMLEAMQRGAIRIATDGWAVGQINGLAVYRLGDHSYGRPNRITARAALGRGRMVNIDRESQLTGRLHDKGFLILNGYLQGKYGRNRRLALAASITFEQSYGAVDGDSASSTELYALLSELAGVPVNQSIAVTGSVNQAGEVQAIGGATYKIEGFFDLCQARGLTGRQGVMIPRDNLVNLALARRVEAAAAARQFHIYAVSTIDEGLEVLTGLPAGQPDADGNYPAHTIHHRVEQRLDEMNRRMPPPAELGEADEGW